MATCFVQNDKVFTQMMMISLKLLFWTKKVVIWWLFNDNLSAREQEREEKRTRNSAPWNSLNVPTLIGVHHISVEQP